MDILSYLKNVLEKLLDKVNQPSKQEERLRNMSDKLKDDLSQIIKENTSAMRRQLSSEISLISNKQNCEIENVKICIRDLDNSITDCAKSVSQLVHILELFTQESKSEQQYQADQNAKKQSRNYPIVCYSELIDSDSPLGFKTENLKTENNSCAFKIEILNESQGTYQFVEDAIIQAEILSAFDPIVKNAADYNVVPASASKIIVLSPGEIQQEEGVWHIIKKQQIEFE